MRASVSVCYAWMSLFQLPSTSTMPHTTHIGLGGRNFFSLILPFICILFFFYIFRRRPILGNRYFCCGNAENVELRNYFHSNASQNTTYRRTGTYTFTTQQFRNENFSILFLLAIAIHRRWRHTHCSVCVCRLRRRASISQKLLFARTFWFVRYAVNWVYHLTTASSTLTLLSHCQRQKTQNAKKGNTTDEKSVVSVFISSLHPSPCPPHPHLGSYRGRSSARKHSESSLCKQHV